MEKRVGLINLLKHMIIMEYILKMTRQKNFKTSKCTNLNETVGMTPKAIIRNNTALDVGISGVNETQRISENIGNTNNYRRDIQKL